MKKSGTYILSARYTEGHVKAIKSSQVTEIMLDDVKYFEIGRAVSQKRDIQKNCYIN